MNSRGMTMSVVAASFALFGFHQENGCGGVPPAECPLLECDQRCSHGTVTDEDGCPTCECKPPPSCEDLAESSCSADPKCEPIYETTCAAATGDAAGFRAPCATTYTGCRERSACENLDEASCSSDPKCEPIYGGTCDRPACLPEDPNCFVAPCPAEYLGCHERTACEGLDESSCNSDPRCASIYEEAACPLECKTDPDDPTRCLPCEPSRIFAGCRERSACEGLDESSCLADPACEPHYELAVCDACLPDPNDPNGCRPCDPVQIYSGCFPHFCGTR